MVLGNKVKFTDPFAVQRRHILQQLRVFALFEALDENGTGYPVTLFQHGAEATILTDQSEQGLDLHLCGKPRLNHPSCSPAAMPEGYASA